MWTWILLIGVVVLAFVLYALLGRGFKRNTSKMNEDTRNGAVQTNYSLRRFR